MPHRIFDSPKTARKAREDEGGPFSGVFGGALPVAELTQVFHQDPSRTSHAPQAERTNGSQRNSNSSSPTSDSRSRSSPERNPPSQQILVTLLSHRTSSLFSRHTEPPFRFHETGRLASSPPSSSFFSFIFLRMPLHSRELRAWFLSLLPPCCSPKCDAWLCRHRPRVVPRGKRSVAR